MSSTVLASYAAISRDSTSAGAVTMSSWEIAELTGSTHDNVMKTIRGLIARGVVFGNETPYTHPQNGQRYAQFILDYRNTMVVVSGYSAELRARVIDRWQELERVVSANQPTFALPATYAAALRELATTVEAKDQALLERDEAVRTKAQIGSQREATAMASASAAKRETAKLLDELGRNSRHATVIAVEKRTRQSFGNQGWRPLKKYSEEHDLDVRVVPDRRYGEAKAWPAQAWKAVYEIDLKELFPLTE